MTPDEWAEIFDAGWDAPALTAHTPAGNAIAIALDAMAKKAREIGERHRQRAEEPSP